MRRRPISVAIISIAAMLMHGAAAGPGPLVEQRFPCISRPCEQRELGFSLRGVILDTYIKPGDDVKKGQPLVRLEDRVQRQQVELARASADDTTLVRQGESTLRYREEQLKYVEQSKSASAVNPSEERDARYRREQAEIELEAAKQKARTNAIVLAREEAQLAEMQMLSPFAGTVLEVHKKAGESVEEGKNVVTLLSIDPLWVEVSVPAKLASQISVGQSATVDYWEDLDNSKPVTGKVIFKSPAAFGSRQFQVRVEIPNPSRIPGGLHGSVRFAGIDDSGVPAAK